jgi:hypothetical protein
MRARFVLACAATGVAALAFTGTAASADQFSGSIGFSSDVVEPGYEIDITGTCTDPNFTTAPIDSDILEPVRISGREDGNGGKVLSAHTKVKRDAVPGGWPVSFTCGTEPVTGYLIVAAEPESVRASISIEPKKGVAGTTVEIDVICTELQPVTSAALQIGSLTALPGGGEGRPYFEVTGKVKNVKPGIYKVSSTCAGKPISTSFTVLAAKPAPQNAQVPVKPKKAPETGDA